MKKIAVILFGLFILLVGCQTNDSPETSEEAAAEESTPEEVESEPNEPVEVVFWHAMGGALQEALDQIVDQYNASQDAVVVTADYQGTYDEALTKFNTIAGTDSAPTMMQVFEIGTKSMINSGGIEPIQTFVDAEGYDMSQLEENIINYYQLDDTFYSMPFNSSTPVMYYNKDAFDAAGLDADTPPATYQEVEAASKQITESNPEMKGFALQAYGWLYEQLLANQGALLMNNDNGRSDTPTEVGFTEEEGKSVFEWVERMINDDTFANYGTNGDNMIAGFFAEDVAMFIASSANVRNVVDSAPFEVGVGFLPYPEDKDREGVVIGGASLWMMNGKPEEEQLAAWDFMKYLQTPEIQGAWHASTGYFAINPAAYEQPIVLETYEQIPQLQVTVEQLQSTVSSFATQGALMDMIPEGRRITETALETVYNGGDVDTAYQSVVDQINAAIEQANRARGE
ncbi:sn-glycerol 3-phosphate transport system substrate-binding protein [Amphibacillus marinus]|uniref:sn-glycerol 3-phosphate transport system substrate-binding protein n=1 Tax=Amphibacillus marinus TaxID=872970 RepID=A0A1H8N806_9BACI|nr:ABC transporter substrate-binding protein [Amphibacillus marinus]SEO25704.1 sn-glycerol 3-phosphate transport system substrate-binding protein [Amphibacillus marinus]